MSENIKQENQTALFGNKLVLKSHPRIAFRGKLDSLLASFIEINLISKEINEKELSEYLSECTNYMHKLIIAEALDKKPEEINLFGLNEEELREISHFPKKYIGTEHLFNINADMPKTVIILNKLRTLVRETELSCIFAIDNEKTEALEEIQKYLNRLSSAVYILMCIHAVGKKIVKI